MSFQGPGGQVGPTGPTGVTGQKGLQGPAVGPPGQSLYQGGLLPSISNITSSTPTVTLTSATSGTHYNFKSGVTSVTINDSGLTSANVGCFWTFNNATGNNLNFTYASPSYTMAASIKKTWTLSYLGASFTIALINDNATPTPANYFTIL
jgi:hypothetical protein